MASLLNFDPGVIEMQRKTLQLREYAAMIDLGPTTASTLEMADREDFATRHLIRKISASILSDKIVDDKYTASYSYYVFSSPWEHLKDVYAPAWFKNKYPVNKTRKYGKITVNFKRYAEYPKANIAIRNDKHVYIDLLGGFERIKDEVTQQ